MVVVYEVGLGDEVWIDRDAVTNELFPDRLTDKLRPVQIEQAHAGVENGDHLFRHPQIQQSYPWLPS